MNHVIYNSMIAIDFVGDGKSIYTGPDGSLLLGHETEHSAGFDLRSTVDVVVKRNDFLHIPAGLRILIPTGCEAQLRGRSGLALNHGIAVLNSPGTIDSDYRGELGVILVNHGKKNYKVAKGDRIAQVVVGFYNRCSFYHDPESFDITERGTGGFGSTGK